MAVGVAMAMSRRSSVPHLLKFLRRDGVIASATIKPRRWRNLTDCLAIRMALLYRVRGGNDRYGRRRSH